MNIQTPALDNTPFVKLASAAIDRNRRVASAVVDNSTEMVNDAVERTAKVASKVTSELNGMWHEAADALAGLAQNGVEKTRSQEAPKARK